MSGNDVRLSVALFVWGDGGEKNKCRLARLEYLPRPREVFSVRINVIRTKHHEIIFNLIRGSRDRMCEPQRLFLLFRANLNPKIPRRQKLNNALAKMRNHHDDFRNTA